MRTRLEIAKDEIKKLKKTLKHLEKQRDQQAYFAQKILNDNFNLRALLTKYTYPECYKYNYN